MNIRGLAIALSFAVAGHANAQSTPPSTVSIQFINQQPADQWLTRVFIGQPVLNTTDEVIGDINDLVFNARGKIKTVVLGVGGFVGIGEKNVGVPYEALTFRVGSKGERIIVVAVSKGALQNAPTFVSVEKTTLDRVEDKAAKMGQSTIDKAVELKDRAVKKIDEMRTTEPAKK